MSAGVPSFVCNQAGESCGNLKSEHDNDKRSFIISVDHSGNIEVSPSVQDTEMCAPKIANESQQGKRCGKQRIQIALLEDTESSDEEPEEDNIIKIDAQTLGTMQDHFVRIYNKNVNGKPSFVVLENALVRERVKQTIHSLCGRNTCHCNAQQQTTPCDIGAHTGCQTDEFLLKCALRTQLINGQSIGCQASDVNVELPVYNRCHGSTSKRNLRRLSQMQNVQRHVSNQPAAVQTTATCEPAPSVTISFMPQHGSQVLQQQQLQQQQEKMVCAATAAQSQYTTCCTNLSAMPSCACNNERAQAAAATRNNKYFLGATDNSYAYFCRSHIQQQQPVPQQQQLPLSYPEQLAIPQVQQQYPCPATAYNNCGSSCSLWGPALAQTISSGQATLLPNYSSPHMQFIPEAPTMRQPQQYPMAAWPPQATNPYLYYPVPTYSIGAPQNSDCPMQPSLNEQQQYVCTEDGSNSSTMEIPVRRERTRRHKVKLSPQLVTEQQVELRSSTSQVTVRRLEQPAKKELVQHRRNKAGALKSSPSKLYMARFGSTCLILKPTTSSVPRPIA